MTADTPSQQHALEKLGEVVHISVSAIRVPGGVTRIGHLPMSRDALDRSVVELVSEAMTFVRQAIQRQK